MAGEVGDARPGKNEKSAVIDHSGEIELAQGVGPGDPGIARSHAPRGAGEQQTGQRRQFGVGRANPVAQLCTEGSAVAKIMIAVEVFAKETSLASVLDQLQLDGPV